MRNLMRYMQILKLAGEIVGTYGKFPDPDDEGAQRARLIYNTAFEELVRQGMPCEEAGEMLVIRTDGEEYAVNRHGLYAHAYLGRRPAGMPQWAGMREGSLLQGSVQEEGPERQAAVFRKEDVPGVPVARRPLDLYGNAPLDDPLDETRVMTIDDYESEQGDDEDEEGVEEADPDTLLGAAAAEEYETDNGAEPEAAENDLPEEESSKSPVEAYAAVGDSVSIMEEEPAEEPEEPEDGAGMPAMPEDTGYGPGGWAAEPAEPEEEPEGDDLLPPVEAAEPELEMDNGGSRETTAAEPADTGKGQEAAPHYEKRGKARRPAVEMGPSLYKNDFTFNDGVITITAPNGSRERARLLSVPLTLENGEHEYLFLCALEKGSSFTRKGTGDETLKINGYPVVFRAWMDDSGYHTECRLGNDFKDRGVSLSYDIRKKGGSGGHVVLSDDDGRLNVHIIPTGFKNTEEGEAYKLLYYIDNEGNGESGTTTKSKPICFEQDGIRYRVVCKWKNDTLYGRVNAAD